MYWAVITSLEQSKPAGLRVALTDDDTLFNRWSGFHPISQVFLIACAADFGIVTLKKTLAPLAANSKICASTVGSVTSYGSILTTSSSALSPSPRKKPSR